MKWKVLIGLLIVVLLILTVVAALADEEWLVYLPHVVKGYDPGVPTSTPLPTPTATPTPRPCALFVINHVASASIFDGFCYEVLGTDIGEVCTQEERIFYGRFPSDTYEWCATAYHFWGKDEVCAEAHFGEGYTTHTFWYGFVENPPTPVSY